MITNISRKHRLRSSYAPKTIQDFVWTTFVMIMIPAIYWFELFVVLPTTHSEYPWLFALHSCLGTFILMNVIGNFVALLIVDTSITGVVLQPREDWTLCSVCEIMVPPRAWHCKTCNVCILKRDHHCGFCGNCIGHYNQRYFLHFLAYIFIATAYSTVFNVSFVYHTTPFDAWLSVLNVVFPLAMLIFQSSWQQLYMLITLVCVVGCAYSGALLGMHVIMLLKGMVIHERNDPDVHNLGFVGNMREVFGESWKLSWVSPLIVSPLPGDGQVFLKSRKDK